MNPCKRDEKTAVRAKERNGKESPFPQLELKDVLTDLKLTSGMGRAKKNEQIEKALSMIAELKKTYSVTNSSIADQFGVSCPKPNKGLRWYKGKTLYRKS